MHFSACFGGGQEARVDSGVVHALGEGESTGGAFTLSGWGRARTRVTRKRTARVLIIYLLISVISVIMIDMVYSAGSAASGEM